MTWGSRSKSWSPSASVLDFSPALRRAAARVPGPVAERSLAQARPLPRVAVYHDAPLPEPDYRPGPLKIGVREMWCSRCGESANADGYCLRCGSRHCRPAAQCLHADEFYTAA